MSEYTELVRALGLASGTDHETVLEVAGRLRDHAVAEYREHPEASSLLHVNLPGIRAAREHEEAERLRWAPARAVVETALQALIMAGLFAPNAYRDEEPAKIAQALRAALQTNGATS